MAIPCEIKLIKRSLGELKKLTSSFLVQFAMLPCKGWKGYAQLFQQYAESILSLLQPYGEANEVKSLREEYNRVWRQVQVFDQLPKPSFASTSDEGEEERKGYYELWSSVNQSVNEFRYHIADLVSKVEKGKLKPAGTGQKIKKTKKPKKTEKTFQPWKNSGDACFIIEDNRIKFYYKREVKDLRLRNETNPHKLLFLFTAKNPLPQAEIKGICTKGTRPSDIAKQTNTKLNEKIAAMPLPDVPKDIEFVKYDDKSKCYGLWPKIKHKDDVDCNNR